MSLKINVGFAQKIGQPDYGSMGATCNIECDLDSTLLFQNPEAFRNQVQGIYEACTQSVHDELARHTRGTNGNGRRAGTNSNGNGNGQNGTHANGNGAGNGHGDGARSQGTAQNGSHRPATQAQVRALMAIAQRQEFDLPRMLQERFRVDLPANLSLQQASNLIDELKAPANTANAPANGSGGRR